MIKIRDLAQTEAKPGPRSENGTGWIAKRDYETRTRSKVCENLHSI